MNNIHDVRCDIDRLEYYQSKGNEDKVSDYSRLLIEHTKNMDRLFSKEIKDSGCSIPNTSLNNDIQNAWLCPFS